ncbi:MAG: glutamate dehydrogenase, partial [Bacteroidia bacterium]|nr:glutamate dehydrogenase [Bacteroidia bacterium]
GNVGYHSAKFFRESGAKIIAIAEYNGSIYNPDGLNEEEVHQHRIKTGSVLDFPGAQNLSNNDQALEMECDILIPAALESVITEENAGRIKAKIIAEAANGPITVEADKILNDKGVVIVPDIYLNAGGVTVSYFEWLKNLSHVRYGRMEKRFMENSNRGLLDHIDKVTGTKATEDLMDKLAQGPEEVDLVYSGLEETMISSLNDILDTLDKHDDLTSLRTAAFALAIKKIGLAYLELGVFP